MSGQIEAVGGGPEDGRTFDPLKCGERMTFPAGKESVHVYQLHHGPGGVASVYRYHGEQPKAAA